MSQEKANVKYINEKTTFKTKEDMFEMLVDIDMLFIEEKATQKKEFVEVAKELGVLTVGVVVLPDSISVEARGEMLIS